MLLIFLLSYSLTYGDCVTNFEFIMYLLRVPCSAAALGCPWPATWLCRWAFTSEVSVNGKLGPCFSSIYVDTLSTFSLSWSSSCCSSSSIFCFSSTSGVWLTNGCMHFAWPENVLTCVLLTKMSGFYTILKFYPQRNCGFGFIFMVYASCCWFWSGNCARLSWEYSLECWDLNNSPVARSAFDAFIYEQPSLVFINYGFKSPSPILSPWGWASFSELRMIWCNWFIRVLRF